MFFDSYFPFIFFTLLPLPPFFVICPFILFSLFLFYKANIASLPQHQPQSPNLQNTSHDSICKMADFLSICLFQLSKERN